MPETLSPKQYAHLLGVSEKKVLDWIHSGQLKALNVSRTLKNRPRWKITPDARAEFEAVRTAKPDEAKPPRRRPSYPRFV